MNTENTKPVSPFPSNPDDHRAYLESQAGFDGYILNGQGDKIKLANVDDVELHLDWIVNKFFPEAKAINESLVKFKTELQFHSKKYLNNRLTKWGIPAPKKFKGNVDLYAFDKRSYIARKINDKVIINDNIEAARQAFDAFLNDAVKESGEDAKVLISRAFKPVQKGALSVSKLVELKNAPIKHPLFIKGKEALEAALEVMTSVTYHTFHEITNDEEYKNLPLQFSAVEIDKVFLQQLKDNDKQEYMCNDCTSILTLSALNEPENDTGYLCPNCAGNSFEFNIHKQGV